MRVPRRVGYNLNHKQELESQVSARDLGSTSLSSPAPVQYDSILTMPSIPGRWPRRRFCLLRSLAKV